MWYCYLKWNGLSCFIDIQAKQLRPFKECKQNKCHSKVLFAHTCTHTHTHAHTHTRTHTHTHTYTHTQTHTHTHTHSYELMSLCASAEACMKALLGLDIIQLDSTALDRPPQATSITSMEKTIAYHSEYM